MFAGFLLKSARNATYTASISHQQVRFARKSFRLREGVHGEEPLITTDDFEDAEEASLLEELSYKKIRFPLAWENNSPLFDRDYERFVRYVMKGGRKGLAYELVDGTFLWIKRIQYGKMRKLKEKLGQDNLVTQEFIDSMQDLPETNEFGSDGPTRIEMNPLVILKTALANSQPLVITTKVKRGGATYQVPQPLTKDSSEWYALKWMIRAVLDRPKPRKKNFPEVMAQELLDAYYNRGKVIKRRDDMHRLADANKAYSHYRWG